MSTKTCFLGAKQQLAYRLWVTVTVSPRLNHFFGEVPIDTSGAERIPLGDIPACGNATTPTQPRPETISELRYSAISSLARVADWPVAFWRLVYPQNWTNRLL